MWLMMLGGVGMVCVATMRYFKETNAGKATAPDLLPGSKQSDVPQEKTTVSTIQAELVPPAIE